MRLPIKEYCININSTIKEAMKNIDKNLTSGSLVVDNNMKLMGVITDGDIRRAILKGNSIDGKIKEIYKKNCKVISSLVSKKKAKEIMLKHKIRQLPVIDKENRIENLYFLDDIISYDKKENYVIIMAGGLGTRLRPLTEDIPKPMLHIGDKPMLEQIINNFKEYGFRKFLISVNYKGHIIEDYFGDGESLGVDIDYIKEDEPLGTAGAISLVKEKLRDDFIVINGDILTTIDFDQFLNIHKDKGNYITAGVRKYDMKIPYGVIAEENASIKEIREKPEYSFNIISGIYALSPKILDYIEENKFLNMTDLINDVSKENTCGMYDIKSYWMDIGEMDNYNRANEDIKKFF